jgi:hypothetical protein
MGAIDQVKTANNHDARRFTLEVHELMPSIVSVSRRSGSGIRRSIGDHQSLALSQMRIDSQPVEFCQGAQTHTVAPRQARQGFALGNPMRVRSNLTRMQRRAAESIGKFGGCQTQFTR